MAVGYLATSVSPNVWVAAVFCVVAGIGNGMAILCNALLVQRGTFDVMRGRALTFVMSATYALVGVGEASRGAPASTTPARAGSGPERAVRCSSPRSPALLMARNLGGETAAEAEHRPEHARVAAA